MWTSRLVNFRHLSPQWRCVVHECPWRKSTAKCCSCHRVPFDITLLHYTVWALKLRMKAVSQVRMLCQWAFRTASPKNETGQPNTQVLRESSRSDRSANWLDVSSKDTEISYRGVPGIRVPGWIKMSRPRPCLLASGLQTQVQESRVWKDLNDTESSSKSFRCKEGKFRLQKCSF